MKRILASVEGIQKSHHYHHNIFLHDLESDLIHEYDSLLKQKDEFWRAKSRINWLSEGDANTKFLYTSTISRMRKNHILFLKDELRNEYHSEEQVKDHIMSFFTKLYSTNYHSSRRVQMENINTPNALTT